MRKLLLSILALLLAPALFAEVVDLEVVSVTVDKPTIGMGEPYSFAARLRNHGPDAAHDVTAYINTHSGAFPLSVEEPAGWLCRRYVSVDIGIKCTTAVFPANTEVEFRGTLLAPRDVATSATMLFLSARTATAISRPNDASRFPRLTLVTSPNVADLGITATPRGGAREGTQALIDVAVTNYGPAIANDVVVAFDRRDEEYLVDASAAGDGWTCGPSLYGVLCRAATIPAGTTSTFVARMTAPAREAEIDIAFAVQAGKNRDTAWRNDVTSAYLGVGSPENWRRILVPLVQAYQPGANGAEWRTDVTMMIRSTTQLELHPGSCKPLANPCFPAPLHSPFNAEIHLDTNTLTPGGQLLYARPQDEPKLHFNARIYDGARMEKTAGAEIPVVREHELYTDTISLIGIPVAPQYRHTLRVYDADARPGSHVRISVYAGSEITPRVSEVRELARPAETRELTSARLPSLPGYLEVRLADLGSLDGFETLRIDIEPITPGLRFWGFVSITNNETHHVTTVTPQ